MLRELLFNRKLFVIGVVCLTLNACKKDKVEPCPPPDNVGGSGVDVCPWEYYFDWINSFVSSDSTDGIFIYNPFSPSHSYTAITNTSGNIEEYIIDAATGAKYLLPFGAEFARPKFVDDSLMAYTESYVPHFYNYIQGTSTQFVVQEAGDFLFFQPNQARTVNLMLKWNDGTGGNVNKWRLVDNSGNNLSFSTEFENIDFTNKQFWVGNNNIAFLTSNGIIIYNVQNETLTSHFEGLSGDDIIIHGCALSDSELILQSKYKVYHYNISTQMTTVLYEAAPCGTTLNELSYDSFNQKLYGSYENVIIDTLPNGSLVKLVVHQQAFNTDINPFFMSQLGF